MSAAQQPTGKIFTLAGLVVKQVSVEPCYRLVAIGKGLPQTCTCSGCVDRGDLGKVIQPA